MSAATRALLVTACLIALGSVVALIRAVDARSAGDKTYVTGPFLSIDEISNDPAHFDGKRVAIVCYLWPGMEGLGLSTMPTSKRWVYDRELNRNVCQGNDLLAKCTGGWDFSLYDDSSVQNAYQRGDGLVVVEGVYHKSNYGPAGSMLKDSPYVEVRSCRPLIRAGGRLPNATMEKK